MPDPDQLLMPSGRPPRAFLVDGTSLLYRAHFALLRNPLVTSKGEHVSAVYGLASTLLRLWREEKPERLVVAFDLKAPTFRHEQYTEYKAHRRPMPDELVSQIPRAHQLLDALGMRRIACEGIEADDLIGTLAVLVQARGEEAVIVSSDKDFMQLVSNGIRQWIPPRGQEPGQWVDAASVLERWGVAPERMVDLLALMGDASDNVPGVAGIGEKSAAKLLQKFGSLDELYARLDEVEPKSIREKLALGRESAFLSRELVTIRTDLSPPCQLEELVVPPLGSRPELVPLLQELEFRRLLDGLGLGPAVGETWESDYRALLTLEQLDAYLEPWRESHPPLALEIEITSLAARRAVAVGISLAFEEGRAVYLPLGHRDGPNLPLEGVVQRLRPILQDAEVVLIGQNMKTDLHVLAGLGLEVKAKLRDTLLAAYLLDPEGSHNLDALSLEHLHHQMIPITSLIGVGKKAITLEQVEISRMAEYAAEHADVALRIFNPLSRGLERLEIRPLWEELESPLVPVILRMEQAGVRIDPEYLRALSREMEFRVGQLTEEIHRAAEESFNINSPAQLAHILFERLKLPRKRKTQTGYSTDQEVLEELATLHPVPRLVLEHRSLTKLKGTYVDALPALIDPNTGRIHASFHQTGAATGRLSSSDPNMQNIPIRSAMGRQIRTAFIAEPGHLFLCADYSQVELRILAHLSQDPGLLDAFREGRDIHTATAERVFGVPAQQVDAEMRSRAKTVNFGVIYGMGPQRLARELLIPTAEARRFIEEYFAQMPGVRRYFETRLARARQEGYVTTLFGRRRIVRGLDSPDSRLRSQGERIVGNTPIQGSAADLIKRAMLRVDEELSRLRLRSRLILQVHDELVLECPNEEIEEVGRVLRRAMEGAAELSVPLQVELGTGPNWAEAHP